MFDGEQLNNGKCNIIDQDGEGVIMRILFLIHCDGHITLTSGYILF